MNESEYINGSNYQEWLLHYVDDELSPAQRQLVHQFLQNNPHLQVQFQTLLDTINMADEKISFTQKDKLLKPVDEPCDISDEILILMLDGELDEKASRQMKDNASPQLQRRLQQLAATYSIADSSIVYTNKQALYKQARPAAIVYWMPRVAATVALFVFGFWIFGKYNQHSAHNNETAIASEIREIQPDSPGMVVNTTPEPEKPGGVNTSVPTETITIPYTETGKEAAKDIAHAVHHRQVSGEEQAIDNNLTSGATPSPQPENITKEQEPKEHTTTAIYNIEKKLTSPIVTPSLSPTPETPVIATSQPDAAKKRPGFFRNMTERLKDRAMEVLSDDNENINVAGFAINVRK